ncbi:hypothetical protein QZH41_005230, partial [Actinostola sp. cb2023]
MQPLYDCQRSPIEGVTQLHCYNDMVWALKKDGLVKLNGRQESVPCCFSDNETLTCFVPTYDTIWLGFSTGHIMIIESESGKLLTVFRPYSEGVNHLLFYPDANPPMVFSCGKTQSQCLGEGNVILPLAIESSEMVKVSEAQRKLSMKTSFKLRPVNKFEGNWERVNDDGFGDVLIAWQALT